MRKITDAFDATSFALREASRVGGTLNGVGAALDAAVAAIEDAYDVIDAANAVIATATEAITIADVQRRSGLEGAPDVGELVERLRLTWARRNERCAKSSRSLPRAT